MFHSTRYVRTNHRKIVLRSIIPIQFPSGEYTALSGNIIKYYYPLRAELKNVVKTIKMFCKRLHNSDLFVLLPAKSVVVACFLQEFSMFGQHQKCCIKLTGWILQGYESWIFPIKVTLNYPKPEYRLSIDLQQVLSRDKNLNRWWLFGNVVSHNPTTEERNA